MSRTLRSTGVTALATPGLLGAAAPALAAPPSTRVRSVTAIGPVAVGLVLD